MCLYSDLDVWYPPCTLTLLEVVAERGPRLCLGREERMIMEADGVGLVF